MLTKVNVVLHATAKGLECQEAKNSDVIISSAGYDFIMIKSVSLLVFALIAGWLIGTVLPLSLWRYSDCHRLGGSVRSVNGPGKVLECVIPLRADER